jgi:hypothetical protein
VLLDVVPQRGQQALVVAGEGAATDGTAEQVVRASQKISRVQERPPCAPSIWDPQAARPPSKGGQARSARTGGTDNYRPLRHQRNGPGQIGQRRQQRIDASARALQHAIRSEVGIRHRATRWRDDSVASAADCWELDRGRRDPDATVDGHSLRSPRVTTANCRSAIARRATSIPHGRICGAAVEPERHATIRGPSPLDTWVHLMRGGWRANRPTFPANAWPHKRYDTCK